LSQDDDEDTQIRKPSLKRSGTSRKSLSQMSVQVEEKETSAIESFVESTLFQGCMAALIVANAVVMGLETDLSELECWDLVENLFLGVFTFELLMKCVASGCVHLFSPKNSAFGWNLFDLLVVSIGLFDTVMMLWFEQDGGGMATLFRIIRLLRIMRLFRLVRFLKQLYLLAFGFVEAVQAVFWVSVLMGVVLYVCSIVMVRTLGRLPDTDRHAEFLHDHFCDIRTSMLTLFVLMSSPDLPLFIEQDGLLFERPLLLIFLMSFIVIGSFGMIALLTGVISESMFEKNQLRMEEARKEQDELMQALEKDAQTLHSGLVLDENGEASVEEVRDNALPKLAKLLEEKMVDFTDHTLFKLVMVMDTDGEGRISCDEFTHAIMSVASGLKPLSIQEVHHNVTVSRHKVVELGSTVADIVMCLDDLRSDVKDVLIAVGSKEYGSAANSVAAAPTSDAVPSLPEFSSTPSWKGAGGWGPTSLETLAPHDDAKMLSSLATLETCVRECSERQERIICEKLSEKLSDLRCMLSDDVETLFSEWNQKSGSIFASTVEGHHASHGRNGGRLISEREETDASPLAAGVAPAVANEGSMSDSLDEQCLSEDAIFLELQGQIRGLVEEAAKPTSDPFFELARPETTAAASLARRSPP